MAAGCSPSGTSVIPFPLPNPPSPFIPRTIWTGDQGLVLESPYPPACAKCKGTHLWVPSHFGGLFLSFTGWDALSLFWCVRSVLNTYMNHYGAAVQSSEGMLWATHTTIVTQQYYCCCDTVVIILRLLDWGWWELILAQAQAQAVFLCISIL